MEALAVVEVLGRQGEVLHRQRLYATPAIIGRGFDADVMVDDPHVAARHLRIEPAENGRFLLADLETHNGFSVVGRNDRQRTKTTEIQAGELIRLGHSQIRIWCLDSPVSPELPIRDARQVPTWMLSAAWMVALLGLMGWLTWIEAVGPNRYGEIGARVMTTAILIFIWSGFWWLSSRSSRRMGTYLAHVAVAASTVWLLLVTDMARAMTFFSFDLHSPSQSSKVLLGTFLALGLYRHLRLSSRKSNTPLAILSIVVVTAFVAPMSFISAQNELDKMGQMAVPDTLWPPWTRVADGVVPEEFVRQSMAEE